MPLHVIFVGMLFLTLPPSTPTPTPPPTHAQCPSPLVYIIPSGGPLVETVEWVGVVLISLVFSSMANVVI